MIWKRKRDRERETDRDREMGRWRQERSEEMEGTGKWGGDRKGREGKGGG